MFLTISKKKMRTKKLFIIDIALAFVSPLTFISGIMLHAAGHGIVNEKLWLIIHLTVGLVFLACSIIHVFHHLKWYKTLAKGTGQHNKITICLSVLYVFVTLTGLFLITQKERNLSHLGIFHYQMSILFTLLGAWHFIKRFHVLKNMYVGTIKKNS